MFVAATGIREIEARLNRINFRGAGFLRADKPSIHGLVSVSDELLSYLRRKGSFQVLVDNFPESFAF